MITTFEPQKKLVLLAKSLVSIIKVSVEPESQYKILDNTNFLSVVYDNKYILKHGNIFYTSNSFNCVIQTVFPATSTNLTNNKVFLGTTKFLSGVNHIIPAPLVNVNNTSESLVMFNIQTYLDSDETLTIGLETLDDISISPYNYIYFKIYSI